MTDKHITEESNDTKNKDENEPIWVAVLIVVILCFGFGVFTGGVIFHTEGVKDIRCKNGQTEILYDKGDQVRDWIKVDHKCK